MAEPFDAAKGGFMLKRGRLVKSWKLRYFQLADDTKALRYYTKEPDEGGVLKGELALVDAVARVAHQHRVQMGRENYFVVVSGARQLHLSAPDEATMQGWVAAVGSASMHEDLVHDSTAGAVTEAQL